MPNNYHIVAEKTTKKLYMNTPGVDLTQIRLYLLTSESTNWVVITATKMKVLKS